MMNLSRFYCNTPKQRLYLTPEEVAYLDPTHAARDWLKKFNRDVAEKASPFIKTQWSVDRIFDKYYRSLMHFRVPAHEPYLRYVDEMATKVAPQGGTIPLETLVAMLEEYYDVPAGIHIDPTLYQARDFLIRRIRDRIRDHGGPQISSVVADALHTSAALPTMLHKGTYLAETVGFPLHFGHLWPLVPGFRRMRNKLRTIFMDSVVNYRYIASALTAAREWLKAEFPEYFDAWRNPMLSLNRRLTATVDSHHCTVESDFVGMDKSFSWKVLQELILPIYEVLLPDCFLSLAAALEEYFLVPLFLGDYMLVGQHTLFSGIPITNDVETLYGVILNLAGIFSVGWPLERTQQDNLGDDSRLSLLGASQAIGEKVLAFQRDVSGQAGLQIHGDGKSRVSTQDIRFCRKVYYARGVRDTYGVLVGAYPSNLALNNIVQPERPIFKESQAAIADLQRLDNIAGTPEYTTVLQLFAKVMDYKCLSFTADDVAVVNARDWWVRVYGERWSPDKSPSAIRLSKMGLLTFSTELDQ
jgi:hypothetical protein